MHIAHAKDATDMGFAVLGQGSLHWDSQLAALTADNFQGGISVEPRTGQGGAPAPDDAAAILAYLRRAL